MSDIIVSGKTFDHREALKSLGGKWNADRKVWYFPDTTTIGTLTTLRNMVGVIVTLPTTVLPAPRKSLSDEMVDAVKERLATIEPVPARTIANVKCYGDTTEFLGSFTGPLPKVFFGFSSLGAMIDHIETMNPDNITDNNSRFSGWINGNEKFNGTPNMTAAINLARNGWADGVTKAREAMEILSAEHAIARKRQYGVAGGRANVGRMLAGNPLHMVNRTRQPARKVITLFVSTNARVMVKAADMIIRAATVASLVDILESSGYSAEIIGVDHSSDRAPPHNNAISQSATKLKIAGEPLNLNDIVFGLGHPSMQRRLTFALKSAPECGRIVHACMGYPGAAFDKRREPDAGAFFIDKIEADTLKGVTFLERVRSAFKAIVPEGFPVTLDEG